MTGPTPPPSPTSRDVRMRGFASRALVETALEWIDRHTGPLETELVPLGEAHGRVLASDVLAAISVPPFDRSAMDGYAVRGAETDSASDYNPLRFAVIGESRPGRPFGGAVGAGEAVRIMTGAPLPAGADAVLPAEDARETPGFVEATASVPPGKNVGRTGEDLAAGSTVLPAGRRLRPQDVGVLASVGCGSAPVIRRPRVRLLITGEELVLPGQPLPPHQIYETNSVVLRGLVARDGGVIESQRNLKDRRADIHAALTEPGADVILVSGGSSVGAEDHAPSLLAEVGELAIHGVAMRPSSPAGMGRIGRTLVFLLPGNPVSCLCAYDFFSGRAIRLLGGRSPQWPYATRECLVRRKIASAVGRVDYCRVRIAEGEVEPLSVGGAAILSSTVRADGFVVVPAPREGYAPGATVTVFLYDAVA